MTSALLPPVNRRAVLVFGALVVALLAPWPRWGRGFGAFFSGYGNALIALTSAVSPAPRFSVPAPGTVSAADGGDWAVVLTAGDRVAPLDTRIIAYTPLALFLALALATPVPRRRKLLVLAGGGAFLLARLAFAVLVPLGGLLGDGADSSNAGSVSEIVWTVLVAAPVMSYAAPLAVWWVALALTTPRQARPAGRASRRSRASERRRTGRAGA